MRTEMDLSLDEIAERLAIPKTTVWYWIADLPLGRERRENGAVGGERMQLSCRQKREAAYEAGHQEFAQLLMNPTFRDFVCLYLAEGYKRSRNRVSLGNSDPAIVKLATDWIRRHAKNKVTFWLQYHADQDLHELRRFWAEVVETEPHLINHQRKSNSNQMAKRTWRSEHGVLTVCSNDTLFRARLQAWMDELRASWA